MDDAFSGSNIALDTRCKCLILKFITSTATPLQICIKRIQIMIISLRLSGRADEHFSYDVNNNEQHELDTTDIH